MIFEVSATVLPSTFGVTGSVLSLPLPLPKFQPPDTKNHTPHATLSHFPSSILNLDLESWILNFKGPDGSLLWFLGDMVLDPVFRYPKRVSKMRLRSRVFGSKMDPKTNSKRKNTTENRYRPRTSFFHRFVIAWGLENGSPEPHWPLSNYLFSYIRTKTRFFDQMLFLYDFLYSPGFILAPFWGEIK